MTVIVAGIHNAAFLLDTRERSRKLHVSAAKFKYRKYLRRNICFDIPLNFPSSGLNNASLLDAHQRIELQRQKFGEKIGMINFFRETRSFLEIKSSKCPRNGYTKK